MQSVPILFGAKTTTQCSSNKKLITESALNVTSEMLGCIKIIYRSIYFPSIVNNCFPTIKVVLKKKLQTLNSV
jgi:hypothetical protein